jgi:DNA-binding response OmpR family regulator
VHNFRGETGAPARSEAEITPRILIVDDEIALRDMLALGLSRAGFLVNEAADARTAVEAVRSWSPELIVLDVMLPEVTGFEILPTLRKMTDVPIVMLSAKTGMDEKITGLSRGADDYIAKPFALPELIARIRTALRRPLLGGRQVIRYDDLSVDLERRTTFRGARQIRLTTREFDLLVTLLQQPEHVFTRAQLLDLVWGSEHDVFPNTLETYISYLRAKIDSGESTKLIRTFRGVGYALGG